MRLYSSFVSTKRPTYTGEEIRAAQRARQEEHRRVQSCPRGTVTFNDVQDYEKGGYGFRHVEVVRPADNDYESSLDSFDEGTVCDGRYKSWQKNFPMFTTALCLEVTVERFSEAENEQPKEPDAMEEDEHEKTMQSGSGE